MSLEASLEAKIQRALSLASDNSTKNPGTQIQQPKNEEFKIQTSSSTNENSAPLPTRSSSPVLESKPTQDTSAINSFQTENEIKLTAKSKKENGHVREKTQISTKLKRI